MKLQEIEGFTAMSQHEWGCGGCALLTSGPPCDLVACCAHERDDGRPVIFVKKAASSRTTVYVIGSLRNENVPKVAAALRQSGHDVFDDWYAAGPEADDYWQKYEKDKGSSYAGALSGYAAQHVFNFDKGHLDRCEVAVLVLPAGKSGHLELGYCAGKGKRTYILLDGEPERYDVMYNFATKVVSSVEELIEEIAK